MNAREFLRRYGWERCEQVAIAAGTNRAYFSQIAHGHANASMKLARRLVEASNSEIDLLSLLTAKETRATAP